LLTKCNSDDGLILLLYRHTYNAHWSVFRHVVDNSNSNSHISVAPYGCNFRDADWMKWCSFLSCVEL